MLKDLRLAQEAAASVGASTPLGAEAAQLYALYVAADHGGDDFSGIINFLRGASQEPLDLFPSRHSFRRRRGDGCRSTGGCSSCAIPSSKTAVAAMAALGMATAVAATPTPAEAQWHGGGGFHGGGFGGGFHGGGGGFHGGGWGGGFRGGGLRGGGWGGGWHGGWGGPGWGRAGWGWRRGGWGGGWGWGGGCWNCGWGWGGWGWGWDPGWAIAAATVPLGVAIASPAGLWRRPRLLGQAAGLDGERTLSWPAAREHLLLNVDCRTPADRRARR